MTTLLMEDKVDGLFGGPTDDYVTHFYKVKWHNVTNYTYLVVNDDNAPVATINAALKGKGKDAEYYLWNLHVNEPCRRKGLATDLLTYAIGNAPKGAKITLEWSPMDSDGWILDWYKRMGFVLDGDWYQTNIKLEYKR